MEAEPQAVPRVLHWELPGNQETNPVISGGFCSNTNTTSPRVFSFQPGKKKTTRGSFSKHSLCFVLRGLAKAPSSRASSTARDGASTAPAGSPCRPLSALPLRVPGGCAVALCCPLTFLPRCLTRAQAAKRLLRWGGGGGGEGGAFSAQSPVWARTQSRGGCRQAPSVCAHTLSRDMSARGRASSSPPALAGPAPRLPWRQPARPPPLRGLP